MLEAAVKPTEHLVAARFLRSGHLVHLGESGAPACKECGDQESGANSA